MARQIKKLGKRHKVKLPRKTRSETAILNEKVYGPEPVGSGPMTDVQFGTYLSWYGATREADDAREYLTERYPDHAAQIKRIPNEWLPFTSAWVFRLKSRGWEIAHDVLARSDARFLYALTKVEPEKTETTKTHRPTIADNVREKVSDVVGEIHGAIDDGVDEVPITEMFTELNLPASQALMIAEKFRPQAEELAEVAIGTDDEQLKEAYEDVDVPFMLQVYANIVASAEAYAELLKETAPKTIRKRKPVPPEKQARNFKLMAETPCKAPQIVGAQEAWLWHARKRTLTVLRAADVDGLIVKGNRIVQLSSTSMSKKVRENQVEEVLDAVKRGGKPVLRKVMEDLKTKPCGLRFRGDADTQLLRTMR